MNLQRKSSGRMASKGMPNPVDVAMGAIIRRLRVERGLSQERLGEAMGLTFQQVQKYERGANRISASRLVDLAETLGVEVGEMFAELPKRATDQSPTKIFGKKPTPIKVDLSNRVTLEICKRLANMSETKQRAFLFILRGFDRLEGVE